MINKKRRFLQLINNYPKSIVIEKMRKEFGIDEQEIKQIAKELYNATNNSVNSLEGINK